MKLFTFCIGLLLLASCTPPSGSSVEDSQQAEAGLHEAHQEPAKRLRHVVLFKFKDSASTEDVASVEAAFNALPAKIPQIRDFEWGTNNSPEGLDQGFTHCFFLTFDSEEDREIYLPHPDHKAFGDVLRPHLDKVLVVDYWTE